MCDKVFNTDPSTIKFVLECLITQEMWDKAVNRYFFVVILFLIGIKLKKFVTVLFPKILF